MLAFYPAIPLRDEISDHFICRFTSHYHSIPSVDLLRLPVAEPGAASRHTLAFILLSLDFYLPHVWLHFSSLPMSCPLPFGSVSCADRRMIRLDGDVVSYCMSITPEPRRHPASFWPLHRQSHRTTGRATSHGDVESSSILSARIRSSQTGYGAWRRPIWIRRLGPMASCT